MAAKYKGEFMAEKRMLIMPGELVNKINDNRGDLSQADFINFLIDSHLKEEVKEPGYVTGEEIQALKQDIKKLLSTDSKYATKEEMQVFQQDTKRLLKSFVDFFIGYGLELGKESPKADFAELTSKLAELDSDLGPEEGREVKIKWK